MSAMHLKKSDNKGGKEYGKTDSSNKQLPKYSEGGRDKITPYFYGEKLSLDQELVTDGFPAITNKVVANVSPQGIIELQFEDGSSQPKYLIQRRNSFFDLHNPDLSRLDCRPKPSFEESEEFFKNYIIAFGLLHTSSFMCPFEGGSDEVRVITQGREEMYNDDDIPQMIVGRRTIQVSDDDIDSCYLPHRSPADFCVTVGNLAKKDTDSKSKSQLVRWAESVKDDDDDAVVKTGEMIKTDEHEKRGTETVRSPAGAVRSIHSIGSYHDIGNEKGGVFNITEMKKVTSRPFKTLSFASVTTTSSSENVQLHSED